MYMFMWMYKRTHRACVTGRRKSATQIVSHTVSGLISLLKVAQHNSVKVGMGAGRGCVEGAAGLVGDARCRGVGVTREEAEREEE